MEKVKNSKTLRACLDFNNLVKDYKKRFYKKYQIEPSDSEVTKIINDKIISAGGLIV